MRYAMLLFLVGCANQVATTLPDAACSPPAFTGPECFSPGGGVTRCHEPDGSFWDRQADGTGVVHWRYSSVNPDVVEILCEVKP